ncbi:MAG: hypothetical protein BroJett018_19940 [Chloroflexota bacterium]|nr:hypothetical protein [Chloroflexota bacterium]NOG62506.1 hypothetical protein [Chloroflexota bacterium]GIK64200.1 MAG: hypothetical protein BroJett018_19940 [Chloroflexota bacterium]
MSESPKTKRILVVYASRGGTTREIAEQIAEALRLKGIGVETAAVKKVSNAGDYDAIVLGSAIYFRRMMPSAVRFIRQNTSILEACPVAVFSVGAQMRKPTPKNHALVEKWVRRGLRPYPNIQPISVEHFAGAVAFRRLNVLWRVLLIITFGERGDWRDLNAVRTWANHIYPLLVNEI